MIHERIVNDDAGIEALANWAWVERLEPKFVAKPWGRKGVEDAPGDTTRLGEVIFAPPDQDLIIKWLYTDEPLSVQVHPQRAGRKHEWWFVLEAHDDAYIDLGLKHACSADRLRAAIVDGSLEKLLRRLKPRPGDSFFVRAGTIHALGPGLTIVEVQENSDLTYRLFDHGRARELHLDQGLAEANLSVQPVEPLPDILAPFSIRHLRIPAAGKSLLVEEAATLAVLAGEGLLQGQPFRPRQCWVVNGTAEIRAAADCHIIIAAPRPCPDQPVTERGGNA